MMLVWRHFPFSGQSGFFLQLQVSGCGFGVFEFERTCLLCDDMMDFMFGIHEQLNLRVCLLKTV